MIEKLYALVEDQYFQSGDFNGMPLYRLADDFNIESKEFRDTVRSALDQEILTATFHGNTHIRAFSSYPKKQIIAWFDTEEYPSHICLYPHESKLIRSQKIEIYKDSPYELELAKGNGQLDFRTFDLSVLEYYRNDPRYSYETDFIHGSICIKDEFFESATFPESDQILLKTFGFAYDDDLNRYVAVFIRYLADLSPEHQRVWEAKEIKGNIKLHPDYYASSIEGSWGTRLSIFEAFVQELQVINEMSLIIGKPRLFQKCYSDERPKGFGFLLRPTESEFNTFVLLLDKMMSDNLNKTFFEGDVELENELVRKDGRIEVSQKGTVQLLESWLKKFFKPKDVKPLDDMLATFRRVRSMRQKPAHKISIDTFDQEYFRKQREVVIDAYDAVRTLRLLLANHPVVKKKPPYISEHLFKGEIWDI